jgi:hypothetical protein
MYATNNGRFDNLMLIIFSRQLKANKCVAVGAINGAEAVELTVKAGDSTFDCILMDCEMVIKFD